MPWWTIPLVLEAILALCSWFVGRVEAPGAPVIALVAFFLGTLVVGALTFALPLIAR